MAFFQKLFRGTRIIWAFATSLTEVALRRPTDRRSRAEWMTKFCRKVLRAARVSWSIDGTVPTAGAVVSNHLTYVDILIHGALRPCVFVSAIETRRMPVIGWMSMMAGTVYVTRGAGGSAAKAAGGMAEGFRDGLPVVFFPEGGTSVGDQPLMPLHSGLLAGALQDNAPVTPGFLRYTLSKQDLEAGRTTREDVHWGTQTLPAHLWNLLGLHAIHCTISFADAPIRFTPQALANRKIAANETRAAILRVAEGGFEPLGHQQK